MAEFAEVSPDIMPEPIRHPKYTTITAVIARDHFHNTRTRRFGTVADGLSGGGASSVNPSELDGSAPDPRMFPVGMA